MVKEDVKPMKKKTAIILIIIGVIAISIGLYTILPLFTNTVVDEPLPTASGLSTSEFDIYNFLEQNG
jgi:flagellar basal body-associated protein FliL